MPKNCQALLIPSNLPLEKVQTCDSAFVLSATLPHVVLQVKYLGPIEASRLLAQEYLFADQEARREMEPVRSCLAYFPLGQLTRELPSGSQKDQQASIPRAAAGAGKQGDSAPLG